MSKSPEEFDFSKLGGQQKFEKLSSGEKEKIIEERMNEAVEIKKEFDARVEKGEKVTMHPINKPSYEAQEFRIKMKKEYTDKPYILSVYSEAAAFDEIAEMLERKKERTKKKKWCLA